MLGEEQARRVKLFCQIVDDSGKLLTRRSLSIRRSSSMPWQGSQNLDADPAKPSAAATGIPCLMAATLGDEPSMADGPAERFMLAGHWLSILTRQLLNGMQQLKNEVQISLLLHSSAC